MKIGMTSLTFRNEDIETVFNYAHKAGIEGIEWGVSDKHIVAGDEKRTQLVKKLSKKYKIDIFSLGSYCRMTDFEECVQTLETAKMLGAPIIRVWAGGKSSCDCDKEYYNLIVDNTKKMAQLAIEFSIKLCFEYHPNTLTDNPDEAVKLVQEINEKNVGLYWQPQGYLSYEENLAAFKKVKPYVFKNIHLNNYSAEKGYCYLSDIYENLNGYFENEKDSDYNFLVEFVKDASLNSLISDVNTVKRIFN
ncbi:MAG: sugar phosphate isomerase/epimerase [Clostridia bacterium]|nr:sugar phosphate isomerase/epimerase [Clostridia bacterium]